MAGSSPLLASTGRFARALASASRRRLDAEWFGSAPHLLLLGSPRPQGLASHPHDNRPVDAARGRAIAAGVYEFYGDSLRVGPEGDPWDRPSPSRRFAVALHRMDWLGDLLSQGEPGARQGLRLILDWRRVFGRFNRFGWSAEVLERRVYNIACAARVLMAAASEAEAAQVLSDLARQASHLLALTDLPNRRLEQAVAAAVAGAALAGPVGDRLLNKALPRINRLLPEVVLPDGGHASRSPEAGLDLLFDLSTLDAALAQRGRASPELLPRAIDRLASGVRFFTLGDGRLAAFQGGQEVLPARIACALAGDPNGPRPSDQAPHVRYQKLSGQALQVIADAGAPAAGPYAITACAQPLALEVVCGRDRLITNSGWTPDAAAPQALRMTDAASTASLADQSAGEPLSGFAAAALGPRLVGAPAEVEVRRHDADGGVWLEMSHQGWLKAFGLTHERRLFLDRNTDELRGEDRFYPPEVKEGDGPRRYVPFAVRFHLHPDTRASVARDKKSVLLQGPSNIGWWLRNDAVEVSIEASTHVQGGRLRRTSQIVLRGQVRPDKGGRVRWKLSRAEG
jgi:uncharacterized heparinase superfamily protein